MLTIMAWLKSFKNAVFAVIAGVLGFFVLWFRWSAVRFQRKAEEMKGKADRAEEQAKGYEAAHVVRKKADKAVEEVRAKQKPKAKRGHGLEGQE